MPSSASAASMFSVITRAGIIVGVGQAQLELGIECLLSDLHRRCRFGRDQMCQLHGLGFELLAGSTTRLTSPIRRASSAPIISPVSSISIACLRETLRDSATIGVEQNSPIFTPGVAKCAAETATARSQLATSWQPAAVAMPWISRDDRLGMAHDRLHQLRALGEQGGEGGPALVGAVAGARSFP